jgi:phage baseplate assembly protein W
MDQAAQEHQVKELTEEAVQIQEPHMQVAEVEVLVKQVHKVQQMSLVQVVMDNQVTSQVHL